MLVAIIYLLMVSLNGCFNDSCNLPIKTREQRNAEASFRILKRSALQQLQRDARLDTLRTEYFKRMESKTGCDCPRDRVKGGNEIRLGMTKQQVASSWGCPRDVNVTWTVYGKDEQWVYGSPLSEDCWFLYFENGILKSWQKGRQDRESPEIGPGGPAVIVL